MSCKDTAELITALVDNEVSDLERYLIEGHLRGCSRCQYVYWQEQEIKRGVHSIGARITAPSELRERILSDRRIFPASAGSSWRWVEAWWPSRLVFQPAFVLSLLVLLILPAFYLLRPASEPIARAVLSTHGRIASGEISFTRAGGLREIKELLYRSVGGRFAPMGYDLSGVGLKAVGGLVKEIGGRLVLVTVYEGKGLRLSCFTFLGSEEDAPAGAGSFYDPDKRIAFYTFSMGGYNGVMYHAGKRNCILVSEMPVEQLLELARSVPWQS